MTKKITADHCFAAECVAFDFDGTLCDSNGDILATLLEAVDLHGFPPPDTKRVQIGPPLEIMIQKAVGDEVSREMLEAIACDYRRLYDKSEFLASPLYSGAWELLEQLKSRGIPLAIATNKRESATRCILTKKEMLPFFNVLISSDSGGEKWSKERMLRHILDQTGVKPEKCLFFGDTAGDIIAGQAIGVVTVAVLYGYGDPAELLALRPDYLCEQLTDILKPV